MRPGPRHGLSREEFTLPSARVLFGSTLLCAALACAPQRQQRNAAAELPPVPPNLARIILYMVIANELPSYCPHLTVDGEDIGKLCVGSFFLVDQSPGVHQVNVATDKNLSAFGEQGVTDPVNLELRAGETGYVQVYALAMSMGVKVVFTKETTANGLQDISSLHLVQTKAVP